MRTVAITIGVIAILSVTAGSLALVIDPEPIASSAATMIAFGSMTAGLTVLSGLLLARAPWGRWGLTVVVALTMTIASISSSPLAWVCFALGAVALVGLFGPWLRLWTRHRPAAESPGPVPIMLMAAAPAAPLAVGLTAAAGVSWAHWLLVVVVAVASILYGQGAAAGLWGLRVAVPVAGTVAVLTTDGWGAVVLGGLVISLSVLAWTPAATRTTTVITPPLPAPMPRRQR